MGGGSFNSQKTWSGNQNRQGEDIVRPIIVIGSTDWDYYGLLAHILRNAGFETILSMDVEEIVHLGAECKPQAIVLDSRPGSFSAATACARLKSDGRTDRLPTVALIRPGDEGFYAALVAAGIDRSLARPLAPERFVDILRALRPEDTATGRRSNDHGSLFYADIEINLGTYRVRRNGIGIHLGRTEFKLLHHLMRHSEQACTRVDLIASAWPPNVHVEPRTVNVHIGRLRKALTLAEAPDLVRTVRSVGYALDKNSSI